jgi:KRAB domain-containing zinc finger protein
MDNEQPEIPVICRSIYDEFYVPSDESSIASDPSEDEAVPEVELPMPKSKVKPKAKAEREMRYKCKYCGKGWGFLSQNLQHERIHEKKHKCTKCTARFAETYLLRNHMIKWHGPDSVGSLLVHNHTLKKNLKKKEISNNVPLESLGSTGVNSSNKIKCPVCPRLLKNKENLRVHMRIHNGIRPFSCKHCPYRASQWGQLNTHLKCHSEKHTHQCDFCTASYKHEANLTRHIKLVHKELEKSGTSNTIAVNNVTQRSSPDTESPLLIIPSPRKNKKSNTKKPNPPPSSSTHFECSTCDKRFASSNRLATHEAYHFGNSKFMCELCEVGFTRKPDLFRHYRSKIHISALSVQNMSSDTSITPTPSQPKPVSPVKLRMLAPKPKSKATEKRFKCKHCDEHFSDITSKIQHELNHYLEQPSPTAQLFACSLCEKVFSSKGSLGNHLKTHRDVGGKFQCTVCEKSLSTSASLRIHMRKHNNIKPYTCDQCGKKFMYLTSFKRHVKSHSGSREFNCSKCPGTFMLKSDLARHFQRVHVNELNPKDARADEFMEEDDFEEEELLDLEQGNHSTNDYDL